MTTPEEMVRFARESLGLAPSVDAELLPLNKRGSDRAYYRFLWNSGNSAILAHYQTNRIENTYFADIAVYLANNDIPIPTIIHHDPAACLILMKDLGDTDLWYLRNESWDVRDVLYKKTLRIVHRLHSLSEAKFPFDRVQLAEAFSPSVYKWERDYFKNNFVEILCKIKLDSGLSARLETELAGLAERLSAGKRNLVHRDLQSQNVMICENEPFLIDFQGMRFGTSFYDLGSILCDPYVNFSSSERIDLLSFYYGLSSLDLDWGAFQNAFWETSAQRLMQALGAYGFLGITKGLKSYLAHVPAGIQNLRTAVENAASLPTLLEVCTKIDLRMLVIRSQESGVRSQESAGE